MEIKIDGDKVKRITGLLYNAYQDYLSARVLFNSDMLTAACCVANQALEKQMKAFIEVNEKAKRDNSHDTIKLLNILSRLKPEIGNKLNKEYFKILTKIYKTRYYENLSDGFKYEILRNKFLAELDYSYSILHSIIRVKGQDSTRDETSYEFDINRKNPLLYNNNFILLNIEKSVFLNQPEMADEFLMYGNSFYIVKSTLSYSRDNGRFSYSGFRIIDSKTAEHTDWKSEEVDFLQEDTNV